MKTVYFELSEEFKGRDISPSLQEAVNKINSDTRLILPEGEYYLERAIEINGWKNVSLIAYGAKIITAFDPFNPYDYKGAFNISGCENCVFSGFTLTTDRSPNVLGRIIALDRQELIADIKLEKDFKLEGGEKIVGFDTMDEDLTPNGHIYFADDHGYRWKMLNDDTIRFFAWPSTGVQLLDTYQGELICMRHSLYAHTPIEFRECRSITVSDITVNSSPGLSCAVHPDSADFKFIRFNIMPKTGVFQPYASNADGIHITGLRGTLTLDNCYFRNLGDDALNIHSEGATVYGINGREIDCYAKRFNSMPDTDGGRLSEKWAKSGDVIRIYDGKTFKIKGELIAEAYSVNKLISASDDIEISVGDFLANTSYFAKTCIKNCTVENTRARGMLIETADTIIENCKFYGTAAAAIIAAPDMTIWNEMAPIEKLTVKSCVIDKCGNSFNYHKCSGILVTVNHNRDELKHYAAGIHGDVTIKDNTFSRLKNAAVFAQSADNFKANNNAFCFDNSFKDCIKVYDCGKVTIQEFGTE